MRLLLGLSSAAAALSEEKNAFIASFQLIQLEPTLVLPYVQVCWQP